MPQEEKVQIKECAMQLLSRVGVNIVMHVLIKIVFLTR